MGKRPKVIGVTGGLATGKTTVTDLFVAKGALRIDADAISHQIMENDEKIREGILRIFGKEILSDNRIDRRKLAGKVFFDKDALKNLCALMHPAILKRIRQDVASAGDRTVVIDAPLLVESGLDKEVDLVVVVTADTDTQIKRAVKRGMGADEAVNIIAEQASMTSKERIADHVIDNNGEPERVKEGVDIIWQKI